MKETNLTFIKGMYEKYNLTKDDVFKHPSFGFVILTRSGIEKVQSVEKIGVTYEVISTDINNIVVKAIATKGDVTIETFGEASPKNNKNGYPWAIAEKRGLSRAILKITGAYSHGVMGEDESDDFKVKKSERGSVSDLIQESLS